MKNRKGFTLMEMLIVVAIIAILVAIAIPTFVGAPEKARETTDQANLRSAYANLLRNGMMGMKDVRSGANIEYSIEGDIYTAIVTAQQKNASTWLVNNNSSTLAIGTFDSVPPVASPGTWTIVYDASTGETTITPYGAG